MKRTLVALLLLSGVAHAQSSAATAYRLVPQSSAPANLTNGVGLWANSGNANHLTLHVGGLDYDLLNCTLCTGNANSVGGFPVSTSTPSSGHIFAYNGSSWTPRLLAIGDLTAPGLVGNGASQVAAGNDARLPPTPSTLGNTIVDNGAGAYISQAQQTYDARNYSTFAAAVTAIGSTPGTLTVSTTLNVPSSVSLPSTLNVTVTGAGLLNISSGQTVTINGAFTAPLQQVFSGAGSVVFHKGVVQYIYPQWFGAQSDTTYTFDSTAAFQAAEVCAEASGDTPVFVPTGEYRISGTITLHQGVKWIGAGSQGSSWHVGTAIKHFVNNADLFFMDSNGGSTDGTGGGWQHFLLIKASGFTGGSALHVQNLDGNHRAGEMQFEDTLSYNEDNTANWDHGIFIDGTATDTPGGRGVRSVSFNKVRVAGCNGTTYPDQCILLREVTHFYGRHVQIDVGSGTGSQGMTLDQNWDQVYFESLEDNGDFIVQQPPDSTYSPNFFLTGRVGTNFTVNATTVVGNASIASSVVTNNSPALGIRQAGVKSVYNEAQTVIGSFQMQKNVTNAMDTSFQLVEPNLSTSGSITMRSPGLVQTSHAWNPVSVADNTEQFATQVLPGSGNPISGTWLLLSNENGGGWFTRFSVKSNGDTQATGDLYAGGSAGNGNVYGLVFNTNTSGTMNFCTSSLCTAAAIGNAGHPDVFAGTDFDLTRMSGAILGQPTWNSAQTFPGIVDNAAFTQNIAVTNGINTSFQIDTLNAASSGSPVQRSPGLQWGANIWDTGALASQSANWVAQATGSSQSGIAGTWLLASNINGGGWVTQLSADSAGTVKASGDLYTNGSSGNGAVHALVFNPSTAGVGNFCTGTCTGVSIGNSGANVVFAGTTFDLSRLSGAFTFPVGVIADAALAVTYNRMSTGATGDLLYATGTAAGGVSRLADVAAGSYLVSGGTSSAPTWSTLTLPNAATTGDLFAATGSNAMGRITAVATGSFLRSAGTSTLPVWSTLTIPNSATQGDVIIATGANALGSLADVAAGSFLRSGGTSTAPVWSTTTWPNAATTGDIVAASGSNAFAAISAVASGQVLASAGTSTLPAWTATPTLTSLTITEGTGSQTGNVAATSFSNTTAVPSVTSGIIDGQSYTMPANTLSSNGQMLVVHSYAIHAANTNSANFVSLSFNGVGVGSITSAVSNDTISTTCYLTRLTSSTAQYQCLAQSNAGITSQRGVFNSLNFAASIVVKNTVTGATTNGDMIANGLRVEWFPN